LGGKVCSGEDGEREWRAELQLQAIKEGGGRKEEGRREQEGEGGGRMRRERASRLLSANV
jgi:hypothetical protein